MADKLIETIARWLCEERDPGIMLTDPGYWTRYKPEAMELIAALDKAGMTWTWKEPTEAMMAAGVKANDAYAAQLMEFYRNNTGKEPRDLPRFPATEKARSE